MKVSEQFLQAKKDENLSAMLVIREKVDDYTERTFIRLCIDYREKYTDNSHMVFVETDTELTIEDYRRDKAQQFTRITFHTHVYRFADQSHIQTFLGAIKKDSEVRFKIVAFNNCEAYTQNNFVSHQLYGFINDKCYFLADYVGYDNSASPIRY